MSWPRGVRSPFRLWWGNDQGPRALGQGDARDVFIFFHEFVYTYATVPPKPCA